MTPRRLLPVLVSIVLAAACGGGSGATAYPPELRDAWIETCSEGDPSSVELCACTYERVEDVVPLEVLVVELARSANRRQGGLTEALDSWLNEALADCLNEGEVDGE